MEQSSRSPCQNLSKRNVVALTADFCRDHGETGSLVVTVTSSNLDRPFAAALSESERSAELLYL